MSWYLNEDDRLTLEQLPQTSIDVILSPPYPDSFWRLNESDILTMGGGLIPEPFDTPILTYPYPASLWYLDDAYLLKNSMLPEEIIVPPDGGAFMNAQSLECVKIPKSVTSIGLQAFYGTKLTEVMISKKCSYYSTSFPVGCRVLFYEDQYDQNFDILVAGTNSYRTTETITHDEESTTCEIP